MLTCREGDGKILIETDALCAEVRTRRQGGYLTGICPQSLVDKRTGFADPTYGMLIMDFLLAPGWRDDGYLRDPVVHGELPKHVLEGPQICLDREQIDAEIIRGERHVAVRLSTTFDEAGEGYRAGSRYEQTLIFTPGERHVLACEVITSANDAANVFYRMDIPGHLRHEGGSAFSEVHLSYRGTFGPGRFLATESPDNSLRYVRNDAAIPERFIRGYRLKGPDGQAGPWLAGMTLDPAAPCEAWCHQHRGRYVCFIQENHGRAVAAGQRFGAAYVMGYFDSVEQMHAVYDRHKGTQTFRVDGAGFAAAGLDA